MQKLRAFFTSGKHQLGLLVALMSGLAAATSYGSENVPHRPFALWADVPERGELVVGFVYEESEAYRFWAGRDYHTADWDKGDGESYGIDINQAYLPLQYGLTERWALDLSVGYTGSGSRYFSNGEVTSTGGLMDIGLGVRYQLLREDPTNSPWVPTLTFRAGGVLPGTYDQDMPFPPGNRSAAIEPELLLRKHFGWPGLGVYADGLFRWNKTTGNDQYIVSVGLFQQFKRWELAGGYRHLQSVSGGDINYDPNDPSGIDYPRNVREIHDAIDAGFSYTTAKRKIRYGFHSRTVLDGSNTDRKFWIGGSIDFPIGLLKKKAE